MISLSRAIAKLNKVIRACVWKVFLLFVGDRRQEKWVGSEEVEVRIVPRFFCPTMRLKY
ncbi:hypothetical protein [Okeania sp. SIO2B9]|uniref:hypothetical protein n=1 Tax=Okeania sp. SIO2B9 TaxID=2607782 RepID=UPI00257E4C23|nr:hypothetical protein [Okeania sp. SIO2B9]